MQMKAMLAMNWWRSSAARSCVPISGITPEVHEDHAAYIASWLKVRRSPAPIATRGTAAF
jgi:antirestriction protein ArdC